MMESIMTKLVSSLLNSEVFITVIVGIIVMWLKKWFESSTGMKWKKWEGFMVTAIKAAEKAIPDNTENAGYLRLNKAMLIFCDKYKSATGVEPSEKDLAEIEALIDVIHAALENGGQLGVKTNE